MIKNVAIIANPMAGNGKPAEDIAEIELILSERFIKIEVIWTKKQGDGASWVNTHAVNWDAVIAFGGDGTVHEVAGALAALNQRPIFGVLPGGTCNDFARVLGMNMKPIEAAKQLVVGPTRTVDVGKADHTYFLNFWGIGLITQTSMAIDPNLKKGVGRLSYYLSALRQLAAEPLSFKLVVKSKEFAFDGDAVMLIVGNGSYTGGMQAFFSKSKVDDGLLDVLIVKDMNFSSAAALISAKLSGEVPEDDEAIHYFQTDLLTVHAEPQQSIDCDGEREESTPSEICILPSHLQVIWGNVDNNLA